LAKLQWRNCPAGGTPKGLKVGHLIQSS